MSEVKRLEVSADGSAIVRLRNVRLSFPALFEPKSVMGSEAKYSANFLMEKGSENAKLCAQAVQEILRLKNKGKAIPDDKIAFGEANRKDYDGYDDDNMYVAAKSTKRVQVVDKDLTPLTEDSGRPYAGCYVNATVRFWWQDNKWGKRVNCALRAVQFWADGDSFGEKAADVESEFADVTDDVL